MPTAAARLWRHRFRASHPHPERDRLQRQGFGHGQSYFCDPRGQILSAAARNTDDIVVADLDLDMIREVRNTWPFHRDRRPETYGPITAP